jgi:uncharacterized protein YrzB (UPF0473 family)
MGSTTQLQAMIWALEKEKEENGMMSQIIIIDKEGKEIFDFKLASLSRDDGATPKVFYSNNIDQEDSDRES